MQLERRTEELKKCPILESYRTSPPHDKRGGLFATQRDKAPPTIHHAPVIRTELDLLATAAEDLGANIAAPFHQPPRAKRTPKKASEGPVFPPPALVPAWARASGRAGEGDPLFFAGAGLALLDAFLRADPPAAGALRARLALQSAAASAKILRLNADEGALRDLRFAAETALGPAANLASLWRDLAGRPPSLDPGRIVEAAAALDLALPDPPRLSSNLKTCVGKGDPVSAAARTAALAFSAWPDARTAEAEILALWVFDLVIAIRLRWPWPLPLIAVKFWIRACGRRAPVAGQGRGTQAGQTRPPARSRWPPPPPSTLPPILPAARTL
jgi:hypothetical protein